MYAYRRKPARWLGYMPGGVRQLEREGFRSIIVHCVGNHPTRQGCCYHQRMLRLSDLPDATWEQLCPWFRCTVCGSVGYVHLALDWSDKIDFSTSDGRRPTKDE